MNYRVFDMHVHVFPDAIAKKAASSTGEYYGVPMYADGTWAAFEAGFAKNLVSKNPLSIPRLRKPHRSSM